MPTLSLDLVYLFTHPLIKNPQNEFRLRVLEWLIKSLSSNDAGKYLEISLFRLRFLDLPRLGQIFKIIEDVCHLVNLELKDIKINLEDEDLFKKKGLSDLKDENNEVSYIHNPTSEFEIEMLGIILPLLTHKYLYSIYGIDTSTNILIHGTNSGNQFIRWFKSVQECVNRAENGIQPRRTLQLSVIRMADLLLPYFGESEQMLRYLFESSIENATDGVLCICLDGLHYFSTTKDTLEPLERRLLATLLLLLDGINKKNSRCEDVSIIVVATSDHSPEILDGALLRPGRLYKTIHVD
ncbi:conserved hypothetical protein [Theileria equi strain WA]|uniref:ATPase AAA-type core domain-containing protein n=1 Tax=Theileria equi strain WA TaxID=1537102 RepID=L1LCH7_THEEQ|nr:conserved hypothetical protein [Theileria equi strain WA]EKX72955.1 conserved hypothetical protein [Theileria equi strain WA]|eukprot:XP_004832407.1 conserved hypothetical protein [Theileria equi strain WA]